MPSAYSASASRLRARAISYSSGGSCAQAGGTAAKPHSASRAAARAFTSFDADLAFADDLGPFQRLAADVGARVLRRALQRVDAGLDELLAEFRQRDRLAVFGVEARDDFLRRVLGHREHLPGPGFEAGESRL